MWRTERPLSAGYVSEPVKHGAPGTRYPVVLARQTLADVGRGMEGSEAPCRSSLDATCVVAVDDIEVVSRDSNFV